MILWCARGARVGETDAGPSVSAHFDSLAPAERALLANMTDRTRARARAQAYVMLRQITGLAATTAPITYESNGRPVIVSQSLDISIAHRSGRVAVAVVDRPNRVGIDIEDLETSIDVDGFLHYALNPEENDLLASLEDQNWSRTQAVIGIWATKEAYCKCMGYPLRPLELSIKNWMEDGEIGCEPSSGLLAHQRERGIPPPYLKWGRRGRWLTVVAVAGYGAATGVHGIISGCGHEADAVTNCLPPNRARL